MSLGDRPYMRATEGRQRTTRLDRPPTDAIEMDTAPPWRADSGPLERRQGLAGRPVPRRSSRRLLGLLAASTGLLTLGWAVACGIVGASLQTEGGTFVPSAAERSHEN